MSRYHPWNIYTIAVTINYLTEMLITYITKIDFITDRTKYITALPHLSVVL